MKPSLFEYDRKLLAILTPSEQVIITMYYGLGVRSHSLKEIAEKYDVSPQTVSKYRDRALQKLEKHEPL